MKTPEQRLTDIENFLQYFIALQLVHQGLVESSKEERDGLELLVATQLEEWKKNL